MKNKHVHIVSGVLLLISIVLIGALAYMQGVSDRKIDDLEDEIDSLESLIPEDDKVNEEISEQEEVSQLGNIYKLEEFPSLELAYTEGWNVAFNDENPFNRSIIVSKDGYEISINILSGVGSVPTYSCRARDLARYVRLGNLVQARRSPVEFTYFDGSKVSMNFEESFTEALFVASQGPEDESTIELYEIEEGANICFIEEDGFIITVDKDGEVQPMVIESKYSGSEADIEATEILFDEANDIMASFKY